MSINNMTFRFGGEAGQGVESSAAGFAKALARSGLYVATASDYMSRIRGGWNSYQIRVSDKPLWTHEDAIHLALAFSEAAVRAYAPTVVSGGGVIFDENLKVDPAEVEALGVKPFVVPLQKLAEEVGGDKRMLNYAALGVTCGLTGFDTAMIEESIKEFFIPKYGEEKGGKIAETNIKVLKNAYAYAERQFGSEFPWKLDAPGLPKEKRRMLINGNEALAMGALAGGCRFISAYPMTPASSILEWMVKHHKQYNVVYKQTEDELAAILFAIGANYAGARGMTATSGGGFALMVEALGLAGMIECPLVVVDAMRPGPSTGMPTRSDQGDLLFATYASPGEIPRIVLAPSTQEDCFRQAARAFNLAEKYQCPVIILTDGHLATALRTIEASEFDFDAIEIDRGELLTDEDLNALEEPYLRFKVTESGISPRALIGHPNAVYISSSDEHTEDGHFDSESVENRIAMHTKRYRKWMLAKEDLQAPEQIGPSDAEVTFVTWGSTYGPMREALERLEAEGVRANMLHFTDLHPFPTEKVMPLLEGVKKLVVVEANITGQFAQYLTSQTAVKVDHVITRIDGRPFTPDYIVTQFQEVLERGKAERQAV